MERVRDLGGVGQRVVEPLAIRARQIHRRPHDAVTPCLVTVLEPGRRCLRRSALDHIEELRRLGHVDDRGHPRPTLPGPGPHEQHLVEAERGDLADASRVIDQRRAVAITASITVCQSQTTSPATADTARPWPTWLIIGGERSPMPGSKAGARLPLNVVDPFRFEPPRGELAGFEPHADQPRLVGQPGTALEDPLPNRCVRRWDSAGTTAERWPC